MFRLTHNIPIKARIPGSMAIALLIVPLLLWAPQSQAQDEGFDIMRLITSQWVHPNIMLVQDRSGSMAWSINGDNTYEDFGGTQADGLHLGSFTIEADYTVRFGRGGLFDQSRTYFPQNGAGQGYWIRVNRTVNPAYIKTQAIGWSKNGTTNSTYWQRDRIYCNRTGLDVGDYIDITSYPGHPEFEGTYKIIQNSSDGYIRVTRMNIMGNFHPTLDDGDFRFRFTTSASLVFTEVRLGTTNPAAMEGREAAVNGLFDASYSGSLYVQGNLRWEEGDLIMVSGFTGVAASDNGGYILLNDPSESHANPGYYHFQVARWDSNDTWDDGDSRYYFSSGSDANLTIQRVTYPGMPLNPERWFFPTASRMAITKNILGNTVTFYEPAEDLPPTGTDSTDHPYWEFSPGTGPENGDYYDWYHKVWVGWDPVAHLIEPWPDPDFTTEVKPGELVRNFSDVINWGLVGYSGACDGQDLLVESDPDERVQGPVVNAIEAYYTFQGDGGLNPGGSTPTRDALTRSKEALITDTGSTWDNDLRRSCGRVFGSILMTDGVSNYCNPSNHSWSSCPSDFESYPAGISAELWTTTAIDGGSTVDVPMRTWVIGVSQAVGRCELNYTAYKGRTDRSSPNGDAGFVTADDVRLPEGTPGTYDNTSDYAFFTNSAEELKEAFIQIISGMGIGDYSTSAPSVSASTGITAGNVGMLASSEYPSWEGHLRAFDLGLEPSDADYEIWDAAEVLVDSTNRNGGFTRRIYTWNPNDSNSMVAITPANTSTLNTICGNCGITNEVVDFILGNDGVIPGGQTHGTPRDRVMGAVINSTPAVIGPPPRHPRNQLYEHSSFEAAYGSRHSLVWVGTSDGAVAGFDIIDGAEILRLIPPTILSKQVELYDNYSADPINSPLGQPGLPSEHIYGVANSIRFGDVYFPSPQEYKTVMIISEGPGGNGLHAIDVTHPYPGRTIAGQTYGADPNEGYGGDGDPVKVLWSMSGDGALGTTQLTGLGDTWSIPAFGATSFDEWTLQVGSGFSDNPGNSIVPKVFFLNPATGSTLSTISVTNRSPSHVGNQTFADSVTWEKESIRFKADNLVNEGVQGDLNGHLYTMDLGADPITSTAMVTLSDPDPIYYNPAVAGYPSYPATYALYAWSTGSFYEKSNEINGPGTGTSGHFIPQIFITAKELATGIVTTQGIKLTDLPDPAGAGQTLGDGTQITSPPMIFVPEEGSLTQPFGLYLVYDPQGATCIGISYIVRVNFNPSNLGLLATDLAGSVDVYEAGEGISGGITLSGQSVFVSQSEVGENAEAKLVKVPGISIPVGGTGADISWWIELQ